MVTRIINPKAFLWLAIILCKVPSNAEELSLSTTSIPATIPIPKADHEENFAEKDVTSSPQPLPAADDNAITDSLRQEITNSGNITRITVICPSVPSSLDANPSLSSAGSSNMSESTSAHVDNGGIIENSGLMLPLSSFAKVDLGALEFERNTEVVVESKDCQGVLVDGEVPHWVERLAINSKEGSIALRKGWATGASSMKKVWFRVSRSLIIDVSEPIPGSIEEVTTDVRHSSGIEKLCSVLPPALEMLDASHTPLEVLDLDSPCSSRLLRLEASHSQLTRVTLCTPSLVTLHLSGNSLEGALKWHSCEGGLDAVEYLQVNQNYLSKASTCGWSSLRTLDVRRNALTSLDLSSCPSSNLTSVMASHNIIVTPPVLPPALSDLDLSHNQLDSLPMFTHTLLTADFSHNCLTEIGKSRLKRARKLLHLNLAHNNITHIKEHDLNGLRELRTLDLSHNRLRVVAGTSFMSLPHLRELFLHHNHLNTLDMRDLKALSIRTYATFHHNPWHCTCQLIASLQRLQHCLNCQKQAVPVKCKERGSWVVVEPFLRTCLQAVQEVTQRLNDESDEDFSEEDREGTASDNDNKSAVVAVPVLLILIVVGAVVAASYRMYHRHKRHISARLSPFCSVATLCSICRCGRSNATDSDIESHRHGGGLSQIEQDSDTETEL